MEKLTENQLKANYQQIHKCLLTDPPSLSTYLSTHVYADG